MPFSSRNMTAADWSGLTHFGPDEFAVPEAMGFEFMVWLDGVRQMANVPMHVTSSYRTPQHNAEVGGARDSAHVDKPCNAVDIGMTPTPADPHWHFARFKIVEAALNAGCGRIGFYPNGSLHLDRTEDKRPSPRLWNAVDNKA